jgi:hypothetical protein
MEKAIAKAIAKRGANATTTDNIIIDADYSSWKNITYALFSHNRTGQSPTNLPTNTNSGSIDIYSSATTRFSGVGRYNEGNHADTNRRIELHIEGAKFQNVQQLFCENIAWT